MNGKLYISYAQIAVFNSGMENPFSDWSPRHVAQGFAWRPGSVSFRYPEWDGDVSVLVSIVDAIPVIPATTTWAIGVPFTVGSEGIEIATITSSIEVPVGEGAYELVYSVDLENASCSFWLRPTVTLKQPAILRRNDQLTPQDDFLMAAEPA